MNAKRHHYVSIAYLKSFCDGEGKVFVYRKDDPKKLFHQKPDKTGFHKYYYSQPLPEGGMEHDFLEDFFSKVEAKWPPIVDRLQLGKNVDKDMLDVIYQFICLQYARVPATRDVIEKLDAESIKMEVERLEAIGELPPPPKGFEDIFRADRLAVPIDPHRSILAMPQMLFEAGKILDQIGLNVVYNTTDIPVLTSDNPVIWFDPSVPEEEMQPYNMQPGRPIILLFPVSPNLIILGASSWRDKFTRRGIEHLECGNREFVNEWNRCICRFAYETVFTRERGQEAVIEENADVSPVLETAETWPDIQYQRVFGKRKRKPAWKKDA